MSVKPVQIPKAPQFVLSPRPKIALFNDAAEKPRRRRRDIEDTRLVHVSESPPITSSRLSRPAPLPIPESTPESLYYFCLERLAFTPPPRGFASHPSVAWHYFAGDLRRGQEST